MTRDIVDLVDREADLLVRGLDNGQSLKGQICLFMIINNIVVCLFVCLFVGLRQRISGLFFQYCKVPLFNPEAAKHIQVPSDPSIHIYYCRSCCNYLPSTHFELTTNSRLVHLQSILILSLVARVVGHCRSCVALDNRARARNNLTQYKAMLIKIRQTEQSYNDESTVAFIIQESDLRYLVENIWASQSSLSAVNDLFELILVRWDTSLQWAPWNTVLLSKDEAMAHTQLEDVSQV